jgi:hypothetical protein
MPATSVPATSTTLDPKQQVIAAYTNTVQQFRRVASDPNGQPNDQGLMTTLSPSFAQELSRGISNLRSLHRYTTGNIAFRVLEVQVAGTNATLIVCARDDTDLFDQYGHDLSSHPGLGTPMQVFAMMLKSASNQWLLDQNSPTGKSCQL